MTFRENASCYLAPSGNHLNGLSDKNHRFELQQKPATATRISQGGEISNPIAQGHPGGTASVSGRQSARSEVTHLQCDRSRGSAQDRLLGKDGPLEPGCLGRCTYKQLTKQYTELEGAQNWELWLSRSEAATLARTEASHQPPRHRELGRGNRKTWLLTPKRATVHATRSEGKFCRAHPRKSRWDPLEAVGLSNHNTLPQSPGVHREQGGGWESAKVQASQGVLGKLLLARSGSAACTLRGRQGPKRHRRLENCPRQALLGSWSRVRPPSP